MGLRPPFPGTHFDVVALAASIGALDAFSHILGALPADFPGAIIVVRHISFTHRSALAAILSDRTCLCVSEAHAGEQLCRFGLYCAPKP